jgi:2-C-methyl-D-erythritol 4-phosphate cytidylyltransferase
VHDAARCCVTPQAIRRLIEACVADEVGGLLALPLADTLKRQRDGAEPVRVGATVSRGGLWQAQTPQMFRIGMLADALDGSAGVEVTDEASAIEAQGLHPLLVPGEASNFKVTLAGDLELAEAVLGARRGARVAEEHGRA